MSVEASERFEELRIGELNLGWDLKDDVKMIGKRTMSLDLDLEESS